MRKIITLLLIVMTLFVSCTKDDVITPTTENVSAKKTTSVQCSGTTQSGTRCKNMTLSTNGRCYLHGGK